MENSFEKFILKLKSKEKENYEKYSKIRSKYAYMIVYYALVKKNSRVKYKDVNSLVTYDKAIKYVLYKYLGTFEEYLKSYIFNKYELPEKDENIKHQKLKSKDLIENKNNDDKVSKLYKKFNYSLSEIKDFLKEKDKDFLNLSNNPGVYFDKMKKIVNLRNDVMHHKPLLFDYESGSLASERNNQISNLLELLPDNYKKGLVKNMNAELRKIKDINEDYSCFLLDELVV